MKIAIHNQKGSFSEQWIEYCQAKEIPYKTVNAFDNDVVRQLHDCEAFMWHHHHGQFKDVIAAKKILFALEHAGVKVFPDFETGWHFDDKVAQKYLLEAINAPLVPSFVFYDKETALHWARETTFPKVFKLKGGAGAANVRLVRNKIEALRLIKKAFGRGFPQFNRWANLKERYNKYRAGSDSLVGVAKGVARLFVATDFAKRYSNEVGYVYFQEFIPNNYHDTRVVVINGKYAAAERRLVREKDFRASGSGLYCYDNISEKAVRTAFQVAHDLSLKSVAFDFIENADGAPLIVEISYGFGTDGILNVPGYWDSEMNWHQDKFTPQIWMVEDLIQSFDAAAVKAVI